MPSELKLQHFDLKGGPWKSGSHEPWLKTWVGGVGVGGPWGNRRSPRHSAPLRATPLTVHQRRAGFLGHARHTRARTPMPRLIILELAPASLPTPCPRQCPSRGGSKLAVAGGGGEAQDKVNLAVLLYTTTFGAWE